MDVNGMLHFRKMPMALWAMLASATGITVQALDGKRRHTLAAATFCVRLAESVPDRVAHVIFPADASLAATECRSLELLRLRLGDDLEDLTSYGQAIGGNYVFRVRFGPHVDLIVAGDAPVIVSSLILILQRGACRPCRKGRRLAEAVYRDVSRLLAVVHTTHAHNAISRANLLASDEVGGYRVRIMRHARMAALTAVTSSRAAIHQRGQRHESDTDAMTSLRSMWAAAAHRRPHVTSANRKRLGDRFDLALTCAACYGPQLKVWSQFFRATLTPLLSLPALPTVIHFVTSNQKKVDEVTAILRSAAGASACHFNVQAVRMDLPELQGEPADIAKEKCRFAAERVQGAVMVDDTSLCFNAMQGLPGPYIKWFLDKLGLDGLNRMLMGFEDKTAYAQCILAYTPGLGVEPLTFVGRVPGRIVPPQGPPGFGWDPVFLPAGYNQTFAQMDGDAKNGVSHRVNALQSLRAHLIQTLS